MNIITHHSTYIDIEEDDFIENYATKEEYTMGKINEYNAAIKKNCDLHVCPVCGGEQPASKFLRTTILDKNVILPTTHHDISAKHYAIAEYVINIKSIRKLEPLLKPECERTGTLTMPLACDYLFVSYLRWKNRKERAHKPI
jgi:hypothetical protein